ncbi:MAG: hypothetical protein JWL81_2384 [Verrucomicrobiales bacterium]|nr:hypothetical protein [Verrucomicrobiales bacterium]
MPPQDAVPHSIRDSPSPRALPPALGHDLLHRIGQGEDAALESLYQVCGDRFFSMASHMVRDAGAAREIVQDCFVRIWQRAVSYNPEASSPFTWCVMILRGLCIDHLRRAGRRLPSDSSSAETSTEPICPSPPLADLHLHETLHLVRKSLATLTPQEQETIRAALFDPASCADLASRWGLPLGSAKTRIHRAMEKLRHLLRPHLRP